MLTNEDEARQYLLLDSGFGACGIAWNARGLIRLQLPDATREATEERLRRLGCRPLEGGLPTAIANAAKLLGSYFAGDAVDLSPIEVDLSHVPPFHRAIYAETRRIPWGATSTYGEIARSVGEPGAARAVGQAMGRNPVPIVIPCHRVLASGRAWGGFSAPGGLLTKQRLLDLEKASDVSHLPLFAPR